MIEFKDYAAIDSTIVLLSGTVDRGLPEAADLHTHCLRSFSASSGRKFHNGEPRNHGHSGTRAASCAR
jgi:hypothetical protein